MLTLLAALAFISFGQLGVVLTGGIDISVGPLSGLLVVVASFFVVDGRSPLTMAGGFLLMLAIAVTTGLVNGLLVRWGRLSAVGSNEEAAHRLGVRVNRTVVGAFIACSCLTFLGGIMLMAQIGIGDPTQGVTYTLSSITAVVLGGASLLGGRGTYVGALLGAA